MCSGSGVILIVSIPDICVLPYFLYSHEYQLTRNTVYCAILSDQIVVGCPLGVPIHISFVIYVLCLSCCLVCPLQPCGHLLGKCWPLGSLVCDVFSCYSHFPMCCPRSGLVLDFIDSWFLPSS